MENNSPTTEEKFLSDLRGSKNEKLFIYWTLFSILHLGDPHFLEQIVTEYKRAPEDSWWFIYFHKALRQCDYFSNSLCLAESKINKEETQRLNTVLLQRSRIRREYELMPSSTVLDIVLQTTDDQELTHEFYFFS